MRTFIIAEIGVNHNGDIEIAKELIYEAFLSGADAVKIQSFIALDLSQINAQLADYQKINVNTTFKTQFEMLKSLELTFNQQKTLLDYSKNLGIKFISSAFDFNSLKFLIADLNLQIIKIGSGEITNLPLVYQVGKSKKEMILSTGMATLEEIYSAIFAYYCGWCEKRPNKSQFDLIESNTEFKNWLEEIGPSKISLLHCVSQYPTPIENINLNSITFLQNKFPLPIGLSDHTTSVEIPALSVALGSKIVEKHLTLNKFDIGPDHAASLNPEEFKQMVNLVRMAELALGSPIKKPTPAELETAKIVRKGIYAARIILKNEVLSASDLAIMRPENGIEPKNYWDFIGKTASQNYQKNQPLSEI